MIVWIYSSFCLWTWINIYMESKSKVGSKQVGFSVWASRISFKSMFMRHEAMSLVKKWEKVFLIFLPLRFNNETWVPVQRRESQSWLIAVNCDFFIQYTNLLEFLFMLLILRPLLSLFSLLSPLVLFLFHCTWRILWEH